MIINCIFDNLPTINMNRLTVVKTKKWIIVFTLHSLILYFPVPSYEIDFGSLNTDDICRLMNEHVSVFLDCAKASNWAAALAIAM